MSGVCCPDSVEDAMGQRRSLLGWAAGRKWKVSWSCIVKSVPRYGQRERGRGKASKVSAVRHRKVGSTGA